ncbi:hypothetical protein [Pseudomonas sp. Marseille-P9899]|uniref:hypothetical protein n=1 Tax=Pseudomonas sp. Marseille-P9899 TaxID=2730401 RepID=UPI00158F5EC7|nr:hypothetical protein [Pseudomonas sp. Marseille-P9899]
MLLIRDSQMAILAQPVYRAAALRIAQAAIEHWPQKLGKVSAEELVPRVLASMDEARECGMGSEEEFMRFFNLQLALGERFHLAPEGEWARRILRNERLTFATRLDQLTDGAAQRLRARA